MQAWCSWGRTNPDNDAKYSSSTTTRTMSGFSTILNLNPGQTARVLPSSACFKRRQSVAETVQSLRHSSCLWAATLFDNALNNSQRRIVYFYWKGAQKLFTFWDDHGSWSHWLTNGGKHSPARPRCTSSYCPRLTGGSRFKSTVFAPACLATSTSPAAG